MDNMNDEELYKIKNELRILRGPDVICRNAVLAIEELMEQRDAARWELCLAGAEVAMQNKVSTTPHQIAEEYGWDYLNEMFGGNDEAD
jgi:hypothetical protein